jgi:hypothetical protein
MDPALSLIAIDNIVVDIEPILFNDWIVQCRTMFAIMLIGFYMGVEQFTYGGTIVHIENVLIVTKGDMVPSTFFSHSGGPVIIHAFETIFFYMAFQFLTK